MPRLELVDFATSGAQGEPCNCPVGDHAAQALFPTMSPMRRTSRSPPSGGAPTWSRADCRRRSTRSACTPDDITDLVFTHLHFDHIGWASAEGAPFFPNATIRYASADLEHFLAGPVSAVAKAPAIEVQVGERIVRVSNP